jgi:hypothetical protein
MSIKFICSCGKHLRARDEMAARRSMCPRCGAPVGIPSLRPTHPGTIAAPLTPQERRRLRRYAPPSEDASSPNITTAITPPQTAEVPHTPSRPARTPRLRRLRHLEAHWYQCLGYPFFGWRLLLTLTLALTLLSGCAVLLIPELPRLAQLSPNEWLVYSPCWLAPLLLLAYTCGSLECALTSALAGEGGGMYWPGRYVGAAIKSGLRWLLCFLAGPILLAALGAYYWLYGGDLTGLDRVILAEMGILAVAYWLLAIVSSSETNRFRDANPVRVMQLVDRLGYRAVVPVLVAPALLCTHGLLALFALTELHRHSLVGWVLLACCWGSSLFWGTFLFRLLGVWCYRMPRMPLRR